jgi:hypothetical protein
MTSSWIPHHGYRLVPPFALNDPPHIHRRQGVSSNKRRIAPGTMQSTGISTTATTAARVMAAYYLIIYEIFGTTTTTGHS